MKQLIRQNLPTSKDVGMGGEKGLVKKNITCGKKNFKLRSSWLLWNRPHSSEIREDQLSVIGTRLPAA